MERARLDIDITHLTIDEAKSAYIATKGVDVADVLEVLGFQPRFFVSHDNRGARHAMLGPNRAGRYLLVAIAYVDVRTWRVVTAYWLRDSRGQRLYQED